MANRNGQNQQDTPDYEGRRKKLYDYISSKYNAGDYDSFSKRVAKDGMRSVWDSLKKHGEDVAGWDEFSKHYGFSPENSFEQGAAVSHMEDAPGNSLDQQRKEDVKVNEAAAQKRKEEAELNARMRNGERPWRQPEPETSTIEDAPAPKEETQPVVAADSTEEVKEEPKTVIDTVLSERADTLKAQYDDFVAAYPEGWKPGSQEEVDEYNAKLQALQDSANSNDWRNDERLAAIDDSTKMYSPNGWTYKDTIELAELQEKASQSAADEKRYKDAAKRITGIDNEEEAVKAIESYNSDMQAAQLTSEADAILRKAQAGLEVARKNDAGAMQAQGSYVTPYGVSMPIFNGKTSGSFDSSKYLAATRLMEKSKGHIEKYMIEQSRKGDSDVMQFAKNTWTGFKKGMLDISTWDFGLTDLETSNALLNAVGKLDSGDTLTDADKTLLNAAATQMAVEGSLQLGLGFTAGQVTADAVPFILSMMLSPSSKVGNSVASKVAKWSIDKMMGGTKKAISRFGAMGTKAISGAIGAVPQFGVNAVRGTVMAFEPMQFARTMTGINDEQIGQLIKNEETGEIEHEDGKSLYDAMVVGATKAAIENESEFAGDTLIDPALKFVGAVFGKSKAGKVVKGLANMKVGTKSISDIFATLSDQKYWKVMNKLKEMGHVQGLFTETLEELWGGTENAILGTEGELSDVWSWDNIKETAITMLPMQVMFGAMGGAAQGIGYGTQKSRAMYNKNKAAGLLNNVFGDEAKGYLERINEIPEESFGKEFSAILENAEGLSERQKYALANYAVAVQYSRGLDAAEAQDRMHDVNKAVFGGAYDEGYAMMEQQDRKDAGTMNTFDRESLISMINGMDRDGKRAMMPVVQLIEEGRYSEAMDLAIGSGMPDQVQNVVENDISSRQRLAGAVTRVRDTYDEIMSEQEQAIRNAANASDGITYSVTVGGVSGTLTNGIVEDGHLVGGGYVKPYDGSAPIPVSESTAFDSFDAADTEGMVEDMRQMLGEQMQREIEDIYGVVKMPESAGEKVQYMGGEWTVTAINPDGTFTITPQNGDAATITYDDLKIDTRHEAMMSEGVQQRLADRGMYQPVQEEQPLEATGTVAEEVVQQEETTDEEPSEEPSQPQQTSGVVQRTTEVEALLNGEILPFLDNGTVRYVQIEDGGQGDGNGNYHIATYSDMDGNGREDKGYMNELQLAQMLTPQSNGQPVGDTNVAQNEEAAQQDTTQQQSDEEALAEYEKQQKEAKEKQEAELSEQLKELFGMAEKSEDIDELNDILETMDKATNNGDALSMADRVKYNSLKRKIQRLMAKNSAAENKPAEERPDNKKNGETPTEDNQGNQAEEQRQAEREDGQSLIQSPNDGSAAALSALPQGESSESKDSDVSATDKETPDEISSTKENNPSLEGGDSKTRGEISEDQKFNKANNKRKREMIMEKGLDPEHPMSAYEAALWIIVKGFKLTSEGMNRDYPHLYKLLSSNSDRARVLRYLDNTNGKDSLQAVADSYFEDLDDATKNVIGDGQEIYNELSALEPSAENALKELWKIAKSMTQPEGMSPLDRYEMEHQNGFTKEELSLMAEIQGEYYEELYNNLPEDEKNAIFALSNEAAAEEADALAAEEALQDDIYSSIEEDKNKPTKNNNNGEQEGTATSGAGVQGMAEDAGLEGGNAPVAALGNQGEATDEGSAKTDERGTEEEDSDRHDGAVHATEVSRPEVSEGQQGQPASGAELKQTEIERIHEKYDAQVAEIEQQIADLEAQRKQEIKGAQADLTTSIFGGDTNAVTDINKKYDAQIKKLRDQIAELREQESDEVKAVSRQNTLDDAFNEAEEQQGNTQETKSGAEEQSRPLTVEDIDAIPDDVLSPAMKTLAKAYINGDAAAKANSLNQLAYLKAEQYVRNQSGNVPGDSGNASGTETVVEGTHDAGGRGAAGTAGGESQPVDNGDVRKPQGSEGSADGVRPVSGEGGDSDVAEEEPVPDTTHGGERPRSGGNRDAGGNVPGPGNTEAGSNVAEADGGRVEGAESLVDNNKEKDHVAEGKKRFFEALEKIKKGNKPNNKLNLDVIRLVTIGALSAEQVGNFIELGLAAAEMGYGYIQNGVRNFRNFLDKFKEEGIYDAVKDGVGLTDEQVESFIEDAWNSPYEMNGETHTIAQWAQIMSDKELRDALKVSLADKLKMQREAEKVENKLYDLDNIRESLPYLLPAQQEDVWKAEMQFFNPTHADREHANGKGIMFTNGTGTGKTYTGLGIVKRMIKEGKGRILILTPSAEKVGDWIEDAKNLGIDLRSLEEPDEVDVDENGKKKTATTRKGKGAIITTYANFRANQALLEDDFDLVMYDESHKIMESKNATKTSTTRQHYMLTNKNFDEAMNRLKEVHPLWKREKEIEKRKKELTANTEEYKNTLRGEGFTPGWRGTWSKEWLEGQKSNAYTKETKNTIDSYIKAIEELDDLEEELKDVKEKQSAELTKMTPRANDAVKNTKVVFLSATPFNTRDNLDYAEGYIFSYPEEDENTKGSRNHRNPRDLFYEKHFGSTVSWRYGKQQKRSDSNEDMATKQEMAFADYLMSLGTMSTRQIDNGYDYSRDFPIMNVVEAANFNDCLEEMMRNPEMRPLQALSPFWDYQAMSVLFETMKVAATLPRIREHIAAGRKVVIFHRRVNDNKNLAQPPFALTLKNARAKIAQLRMDHNAKSQSEANKIENAIGLFEQKYGSLLQWEQKLDYRMPRQQLAAAFGDTKEYTPKEARAINDAQQGADRILTTKKNTKEAAELGVRIANVVETEFEAYDIIDDYRPMLDEQRSDESETEFAKRKKEYTDQLKAFNENKKAAKDAIKKRMEERIAAGEVEAPKLDKNGRLAKKVGYFAGQDSKNEKHADVESFNDDDSEMKVIVIQEASGKEGISLHDKTGKHQRVIMQLALPQSPIAFIQIEGRIYRIGQASNAIFEYPLLGINQERTLFTTRINGAASTTENLAMGEQARALKQSIMKGVLEHSGNIPIEGQGVGGKEFDTRTVNKETGFDGAIKDYYGNQKMQSGRANHENDYYPTPEPLGYKLIEWADLQEGENVLEPSAGHGAVARYVPQDNPMLAVELSTKQFGDLAIITGAAERGSDAARGKSHLIMNSDFMELDANANKFDSVVMNPPYGTGGKEAMEHIEKAWKHMRNGGRLIAIIPDGPAMQKRLDQWLSGERDMTDEEVAAQLFKPGETKTGKVQTAAGAHLVAEVHLPSITFSRAGTGVKTKVIIIDKQEDKNIGRRIDMQGKREITIEDKAKVDDLFDELRDMTMPKRIIDPAAKAEKAAENYRKEMAHNEVFKQSGRGEEKSSDIFITKRNGQRVMWFSFNYDAGNLWKITEIVYERTHKGSYADLPLATIAKPTQELANMYVKARAAVEMTPEELYSEYYVDKAYVQDAKDMLSAWMKMIRKGSGLTDNQLERLANGEDVYVPVDLRPGEPITMQKIRELFDGANTDERKQVIFDRVWDIANTLGLQLTYEEMGPSTAAVYKGSGVLAINPTAWKRNDRNYSDKANTLLHELIHSVTQYALILDDMGQPMPENLQKAVDKLKAAYEQAKKGGVWINALPSNERYFLTNIHEFIAEAGSNSIVRKALSQTKIWKMIKDGIKQLFGWNTMSNELAKTAGAEATDLLKEVDEAIDEMLDAFDKPLWENYTKWQRGEAALNRKVNVNQLVIGEKILTFDNEAERDYNLLLKMLAEGVTDELKIKKETGWEKGNDGKWRYEIVTPGNNFDSVTFGDIDSVEAARTEDNSKLVDAIKHVMANGTESGALSISDILVDNEENRKLISAYPVLKDYKFYISPDKSYKNGSTKEVRIEWSDGARKSFVHELQHIIQGEESFSRGGTPGVFKASSRYSELVGAAEELGRRYIGRSKAEISEEEAYGILNDIYTKYNFGSTDKFFNFIAFVRRVNELESSYPNLFADLAEAMYASMEGEEEAWQSELRYDLTKDAMRSSLYKAGFIFPKNAQIHTTSSDYGEDEYSIRTKPAPKNTGIGYKVFYKCKDGKLYPPMVANPNGADTPVGLWLDADAAPVIGQTKTGRNQVKAGGKGTQGGSGQLAYRPGWHLGEIPYALQFNRKDENGEKTLFPKDFVWAEVEYANDVDYQKEAHNAGINANGKYQHSLAGLPYLPSDGSYKYRTNPNPETDPWIITGAMKVNKILTDDEVDEIVRNAGREPQKREGGVRYRTRSGQFMRREDADVISNAITETAQMLGSDVTVINDMTEVKDPNVRKMLATKRGIAYYDIKKGQVMIYAPNLVDAEDAKRTVLHETLGHKGLRQLYGEERYDEKMKQLFRQLPADVREKVVLKALALSSEDKQKTGYRRYLAEAMDEYLAEQAENYDPTAIKWWNKVVGMIRDMLRELGLNIQLTDGDITYMLWRSHMTMKNQQGVASWMFPLRDVKMQKKYGTGIFDPNRNHDDDPTTPNGGGRNIRWRMQTSAQSVAQQYYEDALNSNFYKIDEAYHDNLKSIDWLMKAVKKESKKKIQDYEDPYLALTHLGSVNKAEIEKVTDTLIEPMVQAYANLLEKYNLSEDEMNRYFIAKHGEERNEYMALRNATEQANAEYDAQIAAAKAAGDAALEAQLEADKQARTAELYKEYRNTDYSGLTDTFAKGESPVPSVSELEKRAKDYADSMEANVDKADLDDLHDKMEAVNEYVRKKAFDTGMISRKTYNELKTRYKNYVPLKDWKDETAMDTWEYENDEESRGGKVNLIKRAFGRKSQADNIIANISSAAHSTLMVGNKNLAKQKLLSLAENHKTKLMSTAMTWYVRKPGTSSMWMVAEPPMNTHDVLYTGKPYVGKSYDDLTQDEIADMIDTWEETMKALHEQGDARRSQQGLNIDMPITKYAAEQHKVVVRRNGIDYIVNINGSPKAAQAVNGLLNYESRLKDWEEWAANLNRKWAKYVTSENPYFMIKNLLKDINASFTVSFVKYGSDYAKRYADNLTKTIPLLSALRGSNGVLAGTNRWKRLTGVGFLYHRYKDGTLDTNNEIERYFKEFMENGGETGYSVLWGVKEYQDYIKEAIESAQPKNGNITKKAAKFLWDRIRLKWIRKKIEHLNTYFENATRFAIYMTSRQEGKTVLKSVADAKEASVNFNRKGSGAMGNRWLRDVHKFTNAGIQGVMNHAELLLNNEYAHDGDERKRTRKRALMGIAANMALSAMVTTADILVASMFFGGDDDDEKDKADNWYFNLSSYFRHNGIAIGNVVLPLPVEESIPYGMTSIFTEYCWKKFFGVPANTRDMIYDEINQFSKLNPVAEIDLTKWQYKGWNSFYTDAIGWVGGDVAQLILETALTNRNYMGNPITGDTYGSNDKRREHEKLLRGTPKWQREATAWLSARGLNVNANKWDHVASSFIPGTAKAIFDITEYLYNISEGEETADNRHPVLKMLQYHSSDNPWNKNTVYKDEFNYYKDKIDSAERMMREYNNKETSDGNKEAIMRRLDGTSRQKLYELWTEKGDNSFKSRYNKYKSGKHKNDDKLNEVIRTFVDKAYEMDL